MIEKELAVNPIMRHLMMKSALTHVQFDTLIIDRSTLSSGMRNLSEMVKMRGGGQVSKGSFIRTLRQAERNLREAAYTLLLLEYVLIISPDSSTALIRAASALKEIREKRVTAEQARSVIESIDELVDHVMVYRSEAL